MKKKVFAVVLSAAMVMSLSVCNVAFASSDDWDFSGIKAEIDIDGTVIDDALEAFEDKVDEFNELTGANLELVENGDDHESIMKTRMASNDMPDMFTTHGWSTIRYNEFCYDLANEPWVGDLVDSAKSVVTDANGKVCSCPLTIWTYGVTYNETVMEECGVDMYSVKTWADLEEALQAVTDAGISGIARGGKDANGLAGFLEMSNVFYTVEKPLYDGREELMDGTFSFVDHPDILEWFAKFYDEGFFIDNLFTTDSDTARNYVAAGDSSMLIWGSPEYVALMKDTNPDDEFAIIPEPAAEEGCSQAYTVGEGTSIAISKDSENIELCEAFLEFMTDSDNLKEYVDATGAVCGFATVSQDDSYALSKYNESLEYFDDIDYTNFFDREYMPSGMWNYFNETMAGLFNCDVGEATSGVESAADYLQQAYESLYETAE